MTETTKKRKRNRVIIQFLHGDIWEPCSIKDAPDVFTVADARKQLKLELEKTGSTGSTKYRAIRVLDFFTVSTEQQRKVTFK